MSANLPNVEEDPRCLLLSLFAHTFEPFRSVDDFTLLYSDELLRAFGKGTEWFEAYLKGLGQAPPSAEFSEFTRFTDSKGQPCEVRVHACRTFNGRGWALTIRWSNKPTPGSPAPLDHAYKAELVKFAPKEWSHGYLFGTDELVDSVWRQWPSAIPSKGLVLVAGETGSQKSQMTRGLIHRYLSAWLDQNRSLLSRKPHLLTFEDPVETWLRPLGPAALADAVDGPPLPANHLDYTPRVMVKDVKDLQTGLMKDALRQTPAMAYAGELRNPEDFRACIDFAGTGHLVIATAHAGSVVEAMSKLLAAMKATTSGDRAIYASRILSVVHLKKLTLPKGSHEAPPVVPAMWRRTATGIQQLVSDGLASLLPANPHDDAARKDTACLGRSFFAKVMTEKLTEDDCGIRDLDLHDFMLTAFEDDLSLHG